MWKFLNEATIDSVLLAAIEQFENQATNRLLIAALEEYEDSSTTQKEDVKVAGNPVATFKVDKPRIQADKLLCLVKL